MKRIGTVLVFKKDVSPAVALEALNSIANVVDGEYNLSALQEFDDDYEGPAWYCP